MDTPSLLEQIRPRAYGRYEALPLFGSVIANYSVWLQQRGYTAKTNQHCLKAVRVVDGWLRRRGRRRLSDITAADLRAVHDRFRAESNTGGAARSLGAFLLERRLVTVTPPVTPSFALSERERFGRYLRTVRGFSESSILRHQRQLGVFLRFLGADQRRNVFEGVNRPAALLSGTRNKLGRNAHCSDWTKEGTATWFEVSQTQLLNYPGTVFSVASSKAYSVLEKLLSRPHTTLSQLIDSDGIQRGVSPDLKEAFIVDDETIAAFNIESSHLKPVLTGGRDIKRFSARTSREKLIYTTREDDFDRLPGVRAFIDTLRDKISCVEVANGKHPIYALHRPRDRRIFLKPTKIVGVITEDEIVVSVDTQKRYATDAVYLFAPAEEWDCHYIAGILNSSLFSFIYSLYSPEQGRAFAQVKPTVLKSLPIPRPDASNAELVREVGRISRDLHSGNLIEANIRGLNDNVFQLFGISLAEREFIEREKAYGTQ